MGTRLNSDVALYLVLAAIFALTYGTVTAGGFWLMRHLDRRAAARQWYRKSDAARVLRHRMFRNNSPH